MSNIGESWKYVPAWQVFCFNFIKKPFISGLWYSLLAYTIWDPKETLPTILGIIFLFLSFTKSRFYLGILSPIPCIACCIISRNVFYDSKPTIILVCGVAWLFIYSIAMMVWHRLMIKRYEILPVSNKMVVSQMWGFMKK